MNLLLTANHPQKVKSIDEQNPLHSSRCYIIKLKYNFESGRD
jgi:hypothetical protein